MLLGYSEVNILLQGLRDVSTLSNKHKFMNLGFEFFDIELCQNFSILGNGPSNVWY